MNENKDKLSPLQKEILKRWQKKLATVVSQDVKDTLSIRFDGEILFREPLSLHSTMRVGGVSDVFLKPRSKEALIFAVTLAEEHGIPVTFWGGGSNILVRDGGVRGFVISTYQGLNQCTVLEKTEEHLDIIAEGGASLAQCLNVARSQGAADLAPLVGIPGSVGGAVLMNAGVPLHEMKDVVREVTALTKEGTLEVLSREKLPFAYRSLKLPRTHFIWSVLLRLSDLMSPDEVLQLMRQYQGQRISRQPHGFPSLGCIFKNPEPLKKNDPIISAGQLIDEAGLKNIRIGGARISPQHANFIVNEGGASAKDIIALINLIKDKVKQTSGVVLETEIRVMGEE